MDGEDHSSNLRVESFSCYLNKNAEESFMRNIMGGSIQGPVNEGPTSLVGRTKNNEGELSIFGADKYFNMKMEYPMKGRNESLNLNPNLKHGTPSVSSEASSWISHAGLLQNRSKKQSLVKEKKGSSKNYFPTFSCTGPCSGTRAVYIDETVHTEHKLNPGTKQSQQEQFAFPILDPGNVQKKFPETKLDVEEARISLEVFGSNELRKGQIARNLERKLSILTWDAIPKAKPSLLTAPLPPGVASSAACDDMASDASSDLFEIENISGSGYSFLTREETENMSSCMSPTTQYAPSEASIEWSVVTASAADFSSVMSDYDDKNIGDKSVNNKNVKGKEAQKVRPTGILGCRSYKSVRVAESAFKPVEKPKVQASDSFVSVKGSFASRGYSPNV